jgi:hypothetical protein
MTELTAEVKLIGGPLDERVMAVPTEPDGRPAETTTVTIQSPTEFDPGTGSMRRLDELDQPVAHTYHLKVSPLDDGPLWLYIHEDLS